MKWNSRAEDEHYRPLGNDGTCTSLIIDIMREKNQLQGILKSPQILRETMEQWQKWENTDIRYLSYRLLKALNINPVQDKEYISPISCNEYPSYFYWQDLPFLTSLICHTSGWKDEDILSQEDKGSIGANKFMAICCVSKENRERYLEKRFKEFSDKEFWFTMYYNDSKYLENNNYWILYFKNELDQLQGEEKFKKFYELLKTHCFEHGNLFVKHAEGKETNDFDRVVRYLFSEEEIGILKSRIQEMNVNPSRNPNKSGEEEKSETLGNLDKEPFSFDYFDFITLDLANYTADIVDTPALYKYISSDQLAMLLAYFDKYMDVDSNPNFLKLRDLNSVQYSYTDMGKLEKSIKNLNAYIVGNAALKEHGKDKNREFTVNDIKAIIEKPAKQDAVWLLNLLAGREVINPQKFQRMFKADEEICI